MDECRFYDTTHGDFPCQQAQNAGSAEPLDSIVFTPEITAFFVDGRPEWQNVEFVSNGIGYYAQEIQNTHKCFRHVYKFVKKVLNSFAFSMNICYHFDKSLR